MNDYAAYAAYAAYDSEQKENSSSHWDGAVKEKTSHCVTLNVLSNPIITIKIMSD